MRAGSIAFLGVVLLTSPLAAGTEGTFQASGSVTFPGGARLRFEPLLTLLNGTASLSDFSLEAPRVVIHYMQQPFDETNLGELKFRHNGKQTSEEIVLHDVRMSLAERPSGGQVWALPSSTATATCTSPLPMASESRERSDTGTTYIAGTDDVARPEGNETRAFYHRQVVEGPHLMLECLGVVAYEGAGVLKVNGPDLEVTSREGSRRLRTGVEYDSPEGVRREGGRRWALIEFPEGRWEAESVVPWVIGFRNASAEWDGTARFHAIGGAITGDGAPRDAGAGVARLEGDLAAELSPVRAREGLLTRIDVRGEVRALVLSGRVVETQAEASAPVLRPGGVAVPLVALLLVGAALGGAAGVTWTRHRRPRAPEPLFTLEDCMEAAGAAAAQEDWAEAAEWFGRAYAMAPGSARVCADYAFGLAQIGDVERAMALYEEASARSGDGEADFNAAVLALQGGRPLSEAEARLARALERSPALVLSLDDEDFFDLAGRPAYEAAVARAWARVEEDGLGG